MITIPLLFDSVLKVATEQESIMNVTQIESLRRHDR